MNKPVPQQQIDFSFESKPKRRSKGQRGGMCSKCFKYLAQPKSRYCLDCHAAYMRHWRKTHPPSIEAQAKALVRQMTKDYIRRGFIEREPCQVCGAWAESHHPDYSKPFDVVWLCRTHHLEEHKRLKA